MQHLLDLLEQFGLLIVFINVLLEQIGLPIPAYPTLIITGSLTVEGHYSVMGLLLTAVTGVLIADMIWYYAGRKYGTSVITKLCRISLSPDSCVKQTESLFIRLGPASLLFCKFIPGFASISSALAGSLKTKLLTFLIFDGLGAVIWVGSGLLLGTLFSSAIDQLMNILIELGKWGSLLIGLALAIFISKKWWERHRFLKTLRMARISVSALYDLIEAGANPVIIDTRAPHLTEDGWIPGARFIDHNRINDMIEQISPDDEIVLYCSCPNEVTAAKIAKAFISRGYLNVRPLAGGIDAWNAAGYTLEKNKVVSS